jgi:hypothetical protein
MGLKEVAEHGSTRQLERELKEEVSCDASSFCMKTFSSLCTYVERAYQDHHQGPRHLISECDWENFCGFPCRLETPLGIARVDDLSFA